MYGTTVIGGANGQYGTIFQITPGGALTTLYSFCSQDGCADGQFPTGGVAVDTISPVTMYGTASQRGPYGQGTVFQFVLGGGLTTLYGFCGQMYCPDGQTPGASLTWGKNDTLYGTTQYGGAHGEGTLFGITEQGALTTLYNFCSLGAILFT